MDPLRPPPWTKVLLILRHLYRHEWVLWLDADAIIVRPEKRIEDIADSEAEVIWREDTGEVSLGRSAWPAGSKPTVFTVGAQLHRDEFTDAGSARAIDDAQRRRHRRRGRPMRHNVDAATPEKLTFIGSLEARPPRG